MNRVLAQCLTIQGDTDNPVEFCGPAKMFDGTAIQTPADILNQVMPFLYGIAAIILFIVFLMGGMDLILSRGDPARVKSAKAKVTSGIVGIILLSLAYFLTRLISYIFNIGGGIF
jgi:uncharacterized membrane protein